MQIVEIALRTGGATQAEFLTARQEADRLKDAVAAAEQSIAHARNGLSRWIGDEAFRPVTADLPVLPALPPLEVVLERVRQHPHLAGAAAQVAMAQTNADLAAAAYKPDWRVEVGYGYRPEFSEMAMLQVGIDLPVFTRNRQDRAVAAARPAGGGRGRDRRRQSAVTVGSPSQSPGLGAADDATEILRRGPASAERKSSHRFARGLAVGTWAAARCDRRSSWRPGTANGSPGPAVRPGHALHPTQLSRCLRGCLVPETKP